MIIKIKKLFTALLLFAVMPVSAQVLWSDNFDNYNTGSFTTGQGGWNIVTGNSEIRVVNEPGKGNVLAWGWTYVASSSATSGYCSKDGLTALWNTRTAGNNVLKLEFDFYAKDFTNSPGKVFQTGMTLDNPVAVFRCFVKANETYVDAGSTYPVLAYRTPYSHLWVKVEVYIEYNPNNNTSYQYTYIPLLNYLAVYESYNGNLLNEDELKVNFQVQQPNQPFSGALMKYDNFKLSAIPTRPAHVGVNEQLAAKFNLYPNPATNVVNITNAENMLVNQITVYDVAGKQLNTQTYNNENEIQLNVENFVSGTYMLHLQTNEGTAVKKLVKK